MCQAYLPNAWFGTPNEWINFPNEKGQAALETGTRLVSFRLPGCAASHAVVGCSLGKGECVKFGDAEGKGEGCKKGLGIHGVKMRGVQLALDQTYHPIA